MLDPLREKDAEEQKNQVQENQKGAIWPQLRAMMVVDLASICIGFNIGFSGVALPQLRTDPVIQASPEEASWIASSAALAAPVGCLLGAICTDQWGRRRRYLLLLFTCCAYLLTLCVIDSLQASSLPTCLGWLLVASAPKLPMVYAGRVLTGLANGFTSGLIQIYLSEVSEIRFRGMAGASSTLCVAVGTLLVYGLCSWLPWRVVAWVSAGLPLIFLGGISWAGPETPSWLVSRGRPGAARTALMALRGPKFDPGPELKALQDRCLHTHAGQHSTKVVRLLLSRESLRPLGILFALFLTQQFCGGFVVIFYAADVLSSAAEGVDAQLGSLVTGVVRVVFLLLAVALLGRIGMRPLLLTSGLLMALSLTCLGFHSYHYQQDSGWLPAAAIMVFVAAFTLGFGTVPWSLTGELFPLAARGLLASLTTTMAYSLIFLAVQAYPHLLNWLGVHGTFWLYAAVAAAGTLFAAIFLPETRGKSLAQIQQGFSAQQDTSAHQNSLLPQTRLEHT